MSVKYNFTGMATYDNPFVGLLVDVNSATSGFLFYAFLTLIFIVSAWVFINRIQDVGKSLLSSLHLTVVLSLLLFYAGKVIGEVFVADIVMYALLVLEALSLAGLYFMRMNKNE